MCRPPRIPANLEERTARRSLPATFVGFVKVPKLTGARHVIYSNGPRKNLERRTSHRYHHRAVAKLNVAIGYSLILHDRTRKTLNDAHRAGIVIVSQPS